MRFNFRGGRNGQALAETLISLSFVLVMVYVVLHVLIGQIHEKLSERREFEKAISRLPI